jgi:hypothetical protein
MIDRTAEEVVAMKRRDLAAIHAAEMHAALFSRPGVPDDELTEDEKAATQLAVREVVMRHRAELKAWTAANG